MQPAPDLWKVLIVAICVYVAILAIGFVAAAIGHGLIEPLLTMFGLYAFFAP
jgi:hypothetical protein